MVLVNVEAEPRIKNDIYRALVEEEYVDLDFKDLNSIDEQKLELIFMFKNQDVIKTKKICFHSCKEFQQMVTFIGQVFEHRTGVELRQNEQNFTTLGEFIMTQEEYENRATEIAMRPPTYAWHMSEKAKMLQNYSTKFSKSPFMFKSD